MQQWTKWINWKKIAEGHPQVVHSKPPVHWGSKIKIAHGKINMFHRRNCSTIFLLLPPKKDKKKKIKETHKRKKKQERKQKKRSGCPEDRGSGVLREQGVCGRRWWCGVWGGGPGVDSVREACLTLLPSLRLSDSEFEGGASDSVLRRWGAPVPGQGWLVVQTVPKTVWRFLVVQKTIEISLLQFIDNVLPYRGAEANPYGAETVQKTAKFPQLQFIMDPRQFLDKDVFMPVVSTTGAFGFVEVPQLQTWSMFAGAVHRRLWTSLWSSRDKLGLPRCFIWRLWRRWSMAVWIGGVGAFSAVLTPFFRAPPVVPELSASVRALEHSHLWVLEGLLPISSWSLDINIETTWIRFRNNNNNNTIWRGSVLTGEEPPPHSGELKPALPQAGGPTQSQLSRPMSSGHHISMEHRLRRKQLNSDTSNKKYLKEIQGKKKRRNFFFGKMKKENEKH